MIDFLFYIVNKGFGRKDRQRILQFILNVLQTIRVPPLCEPSGLLPAYCSVGMVGVRAGSLLMVSLMVNYITFPRNKQILEYLEKIINFLTISCEIFHCFFSSIMVSLLLAFIIIFSQIKSWEV